MWLVRKDWDLLGVMQKHYEPARLALFLEPGYELAGMH